MESTQTGLTPGEYEEMFIQCLGLVEIYLNRKGFTITSQNSLFGRGGNYLRLDIGYDRLPFTEVPPNSPATSPETSPIPASEKDESE